MVIGGHAGEGQKIGDVDFGPAAAEFDEDEVTLSWYEYLLKGVQNRFREREAGQDLRDGTQTNGGRKMTGLWRGLRAQNTFCIPTEARIPSRKRQPVHRASA